MTKVDTMTIFFIKISEDRDQPRAIGEIISASSGMHLYILFVSLSRVKLQEEGTFAEVMDPEGSQCIQRNNALKVKTPGLIVVIIIPLTYNSKSLLHYK
jgi:hypothetical protein